MLPIAMLFVQLGAAAVTFGQEVPLESTPPLPPAPPAATPVPTPHPGLLGLQPFEGRWTCEGDVPETAISPARKTRSTLTIERTLDGFWWSGRNVEEKTDDNPQPVTRLSFWSWDTLLGEFIGGWLDSRGGWSTQTARMGIKDGQIEWAGHVTFTGSKVIAREIFSLPAEGAFTRRFEVLALDGRNWIRGTDETCRRPESARPRPDPAPGGERDPARPHGL